MAVWLIWPFWVARAMLWLAVDRIADLAVLLGHADVLPRGGQEAGRGVDGASREHAGVGDLAGHGGTEDDAECGEDGKFGSGFHGGSPSSGWMGVVACRCLPSAPWVAALSQTVQENLHSQHDLGPAP